MKVQITNWRLSPAEAMVQVAHSESPGLRTWIALPTHEKLALDGLKAAIKGELKKMEMVQKRVDILHDLIYQEIELD